MKFNNRHLIVSGILLLGSILYNVWVFWGSSALKKEAKALAPPAVAGAPATAGTTGGAAPADPLTMPPPPHVDLNVAPVWDRDPFRRAGSEPPKPQAVTTEVASAAPALDPVVGAILFSPERKLAIVDGKILVVGDRLDSGVISEITRDGVLVRGAVGERRFLLTGPRRRELSK